jgi:hypothetical protein
MIPDSLPHAQVGVYYEQTFTFGIPSSASGYSINWVQYSKLTSSITANTWTIVNSTGGTTFPKWNKLTWQCVTLKGTPTTAGTDNINIFVNVNVTILGFPYTDNNYESKALPLIVKAAAGIEEVNNENDVIIFPNPTKDNITIENLPQATIEIFNIEGQLIRTFPPCSEAGATSGNKTSIDVSAFPCGMYIVKVITEKGVEVRKFIKE